EEIRICEGVKKYEVTKCHMQNFLTGRFYIYLEILFRLYRFPSYKVRLEELDLIGERNIDIMRDLVKEMLEQSDMRMQFCEKEVTNAEIQELPKSIVKVYNVMYPCAFKKDIFSNLKILGQLDNKFIVTIVGVSSGLKQDLIVLFDQHAVHERIRLENLVKEYCVDGCDNKFKSSEVDPHINIKLSDKEYRIISSFQKEFERLGLSFGLLDDNEIEVTSVPTCLLAREFREVQGRGVSVLKDYLENMIREQVESILVTRGIGIKMPTILQSVISSEACRGALKFGDPLIQEM
ncbi:hypothetical protein L9F63_025014, partial [Diploptera punctata]